MNKKIFLSLSLFFLLPFYAHAQTPAAEATSTLNAGFFSDVWYSSVAPFEGDSIKIFGGIYNSSAQTISGFALYYIDGKEIAKIPFASAPGSLTQVSTPWLAVAGDHKVQIKATTPEALAQAESGEGTISVAKHPVKADFQKDAQNIIQKTTDAIDPYAEKIAGNLSEVGNSLGDSAQKKVSSVLGKNASQAQVASVVAVVNPIIQWIFDAIAFLVRHWAWSLLGLIILYIAYKMY